MTATELETVLRNHASWLRDGSGDAMIPNEIDMKRNHGADANLAAHIVRATDKANPETFFEQTKANWRADCRSALIVAAIIIGIGWAAARWLT